MGDLHTSRRKVQFSFFIPHNIITNQYFKWIICKKNAKNINKIIKNVDFILIKSYNVIEKKEELEWL